MSTFTIADVAGEYEENRGEFDEFNSVILYSEQDAVGSTRKGYQLLEWELTGEKKSFAVKMRTPGPQGKKLWGSASNIIFDTNGGVAEFYLYVPEEDGTLVRGPWFFRTNKGHRLRPAPGTTIRGNVTLTFH